MYKKAAPPVVSATKNEIKMIRDSFFTGRNTGLMSYYKLYLNRFLGKKQ